MGKSRNRYPIHIRFNDLDSYGHVNNAVYLTYFEEGRKFYFNERVGTAWEWQTEGLLLARHEIDYKVPLHLNDEAYIELWISKFGTKSFEVTYVILKHENGEEVICTTGKSVGVCFDYNAGKTIPLPDVWKKIFAGDLDTEV